MVRTSSSLAVLAILAACTTGCSATRQNPKFVTEGRSSLHGTYELGPLVVCEQSGAANNEKLTSFISDYYLPALRQHLRLAPDGGVLKASTWEADFCSILPAAIHDDFHLPPHYQRALVAAAEKEGVDGFVFPMVGFLWTQNQTELRNNRGEVIVRADAAGRSSDGFLEYYLFYVTKEGELAFASKATGGENVAFGLTNLERVIRNEAAGIVTDLFIGVPPVHVSASSSSESPHP